MKKFKKLFMVIFAITMTTAICAQDEWVGKWTGKGSKNLNAELYLFSDNTFFYSFTVTLHNIKRNWNGTYYEATYNMSSMYQGTWTGSTDNLLLKVGWSTSDGNIIQSHGLNNYDKVGLIQSAAASFKNVSRFDFDVTARKGNSVTVDWNDMTMTKTNVTKPYYFVPPTAGKFEKIWKDEWTYEMYGIYTAPNGNTTIGYWNLDAQPISEKSAVIAKTYDKSGKELSTKGDNESRLNVISNQADELFRTPVSGYFEFAYNDGRQYKGMWSNHLPDGQGVMSYPNGEKKEGTWEKGIFIEGTIVKKKDIRGIYIGGYKDEKYNGQGRLEYDENVSDTEGNHILDGLWQNGKFVEGVVTRMYYTNGSYDTLVCEYKDGKMQGHGKLSMANGAWYEGLFDDRNFISGNAFVKNANGSAYTGEVKNNKREGEGTYTIGNFVLTGVWVNDTIQQGKLSCPDFTYEGTFSNGKFSEGIYKFRSMTLTGKWENQVFQQGDFKLVLSSDNAIKSAQGKYEMEGYKGIVEVTCVADPLKLSGKYLNGMMEWTITYPNNDQYFGYYRGSYCIRSEENKEFKYTWADGTSATGIVDKKHKPTKLVYANSAGEPIKGKATKGYVMQLPTNDKTVDLPYDVFQSWDIMLHLFRQKVSVPEIGQLCADYFNEMYKRYTSCRD